MLSPGDRIERYEVIDVLGQGGMAIVYKARHVELGSVHALKVLAVGSPEVQRRLIAEGQTQARLQHPNVVAVNDILSHQGNPALVMEFVNGPTLYDLMAQNPPSIDEALYLFRGILRGVAAAHRTQIIHRDLKPANVILAISDGVVTPKVADFGLVKITDGSGGGQNTRTGVAMGTPQYMSPEQVRDSRSVDQRADIFSLGAILYEMCCGERPFDGPDMLSILNRVVSGSYVAPQQLAPGMPDDLAQMIARMLSRLPEDRPDSCAVILRDLYGEEVDAPTPIQNTVVAALADRGSKTLLTQAQHTVHKLRPVAAAQPRRSVALQVTSAAMFCMLAIASIGANAVVRVLPPLDDNEPHAAQAVPEPVHDRDVVADAAHDPAAATTESPQGDESMQGTSVEQPSPAGAAATPPPNRSVSRPIEPRPDAPRRDVGPIVASQTDANPDATHEPTRVPEGLDEATDTGAGAEEAEVEGEDDVADVDPWGDDGSAAESSPNDDELASSGPSSTVRVSGDAEDVWAMAANGTRFELPGSIPPGDYTIQAVFSGKATQAAQITVRDGEVVELNCVGLFLQCRR